MNAFVSILILLPIIISAVNLKTPSVPIRTKLCLNPDCNELVFTTTATRAYPPNHQQMLALEPEVQVKVYGFNFSHRDFFLAEVNGQVGFVYRGFVSLEPFFFFLESALKTNLKLYKIEHKDDGSVVGKVIAEVNANPELYRLYKVIADQVQLKPEEIKLIEEEDDGHGHSHNHGHSHGRHEHGHSHVRNDPTTTIAPILDTPTSTAGPAITTPESLPTKIPTTTYASLTSSTEIPIKSPDIIPNNLEQLEISTPAPEVDMKESIPLGSELPGLNINPYGAARIHEVTTTTAPAQEEHATSEIFPMHKNNEQDTTATIAIVDVSSTTVIPIVTSSLPSVLELETPEDTVTSVEVPVADVEISELPETKFVSYRTSGKDSSDPLELAKSTESSKIAPAKEEYCYKGECSDFHAKIHKDNTYSRAVEHLKDKDEGFIRTGFKSLVNGVRIIIPYPLNHLDDTGIVLLIFSGLSLGFFVISKVLDDTESPAAFEQRALFDARTKIVEQDAHIEKLRLQAPSEKELLLLEQYKKRIEIQEQEIIELQQRIIDPAVIQAKNKRIHADENEIRRLSDVIRTKDEETIRLNAERNALQESITQLNVDKKLLEDKLHERIEHLQRDLTTSESKIEQLEIILPEKENDLRTKENEIRKLRDQVKELEEYNEELSKSVVDLENKLRKAEESGDSVKSGDGGSWSDIDKSEIDKSDIDISHDTETIGGLSSGTVIDSEASVTMIVKKEDVKMHTEEVKGIVKANVEINKLKQEKQTLENQLNVERTSKKLFEEKVIDLDKRIVELNTQIDLLNDEVKEKKAEIKEKQLEIKEKQAEIKGLTEENKDNYKQVLEAHSEIKVLTSGASRLESEKKDLERVVKELEQKLKRAEETETKLKTNMFHDERAAMKKIKSLEEKIAHMAVLPTFNKEEVHGNLSVTSNDLFNDAHPSLWSQFNNLNTNTSIDESEAEYISHRADPRRSLRLDSNISPARSAESGANVNEQRLPKPTGLSRDLGRERAEQQTRGIPQRRMRSRSAGRYPRDAYSNQQVPSGRMSAGRTGGHISPATSLLHTIPPHYAESFTVASIPRPASGGRLPKVPSNLSNLYYSSDGSPPPNLVQRAGIPPIKNVPRPVTVRGALKLHPPKPQN